MKLKSTMYIYLNNGKIELFENLSEKTLASSLRLFKQGKAFGLKTLEEEYYYFQSSSITYIKVYKY